jgi:hypothetical protein
VIDDQGAYEFIPARVQPLPRPKEPSIVRYLLLGLLGLVFFGFGVFWGQGAQVEPVFGVLTPMVVGLLAATAGIGFLAVAVYFLLARLSRAAERD